MNFDNLGDRMKHYEQLQSQQLCPHLPTFARLDGRSFHTFTKNLKRPFDVDFQELMDHVAKVLLEESNAKIVYTESDELTLLFYNQNPKGEIFFDGKIQKMCSVLASIASAKFNTVNIVNTNLLAHFDCRVWTVPNLDEAGNVFLWREQDATRNAIQMVGQHYFSHKELEGKNCAVIQEMLFQTHGVNFNDCISRFKMGAYFGKGEPITEPLAKLAHWERIEKLTKLGKLDE